MHPQILLDNSPNRQSVSHDESAETQIENTSKTALLANIRSIDAIASLPSLTDLADWILLFLEAAKAEDQADLLISLWRQTGLSWRNFSTLINLSIQSQKGGAA
jgi:hypothetical protein